MTDMFDFLSPLGDPELMKKKIESCGDFVEQIQAKVFLYQVPQYAVLLVGVNLFLYILGRLNLNMYSSFFLFYLVKTLYASWGPSLISIFNSYMMVPIENRGEAGALNRIRSSKEVAESVYVAHSAVIRATGRSDNVKLASLFFCFIFFSYVNALVFTFVLFNSLMIFPAILTHPTVSPHLYELGKKVQALLVKK